MFTNQQVISKKEKQRERIAHWQDTTESFARKFQLPVSMLVSMLSIGASDLLGWYLACLYREYYSDLECKPYNFLTKITKENAELESYLVYANLSFQFTLFAYKSAPKLGRLIGQKTAEMINFVENSAESLAEYVTTDRQAHLA